MSGARSFFFTRILFMLGISGVASCATTPKSGEFSQRELMETACPTGLIGKSVKGSIWTRVQSKELNGQFPASVLVDYPARLAVEVTNLIGAPQAWLKIENGRTELRFAAEDLKERGEAPDTKSMLGGLPLELAARLFVGGVPCPSDAKNRDLRIHEIPEGGLEVEELDLRSREVTRYVYFFTRYAGHPWVKEIRWEKLAKDGKHSAKSNLITFLREDPAEPDGAPKKWSASSSAGEIRVRWKDRTVSKPQI